MRINHRPLVTKRGDKWEACRYESGMHIYVGSYDHEWEALLAAEVAEREALRIRKYVAKKNKELSGKIEKSLQARAERDGLERTARRVQKQRDPSDYANAKRIQKHR